jgi:succinylglutamate desuccinylase
MKLYQRGKGQPEITVIGSLHGDEPAGKNAIERFLRKDYCFRRPVQFIVANEKALEQGERFLDTDLNRAFPGDEESSLHEERLAARIMEKIQETEVLDLHTTRSYPLPFSTFSNLNDATRDLLKSAAVKNAVLFPEESGTLNEQVDGIIVETGFQGTAMAETNALGVIKNFLAAKNVIDVDYGRSDPAVFRHRETVKGDWKFRAENFRKVQKEEVFAERDGEKLRAKQEFYPVLMSTDGYENMLGFKADRLE